MALVIHAVDGDQSAFWDGTWWVDDPLEAQTYTDSDIEDGLIDAEASGRPDDMPGATIRPIDANQALSLKDTPTP